MLIALENNVARTMFIYECSEGKGTSEREVRVLTSLLPWQQTAIDVLMEWVCVCVL